MLDARRLKFRHHLLPVTPLQAQAIHTVPGFVTAWHGMAWLSMGILVTTAWFECGDTDALHNAPLGSGGILTAMKLIFKWLCSAAALLAVAYLYHGVVVTSFTGALVAAAVLGALNTVVRPVLVLLTLPVTLVTLGLFLFVVNALMFWAAASLVSGLSVAGFGAALIGSLIYSVLQLAIEFVLERLLFNK